MRYGKVIFMTDQDLDGSHIKGLCINLFQCEWPTLCEIPGFICFMNTPILKAKKGKQELNFYNDGEYNNWKQANEDGKGWAVNGQAVEEPLRRHLQVSSVHHQGGS